jgi:hypothetical protein
LVGREFPNSYLLLYLRMFYFAPGGATKSQPRDLGPIAGIGTKSRAVH